MEKPTNITVYGSDIEHLEEVRALVLTGRPGYFQADAQIFADQMDIESDVRFALRFDFKDASLARQADGIASQVSGTINRAGGYDVRRLSESGNQIRLKLDLKR